MVVVDADGKELGRTGYVPGRTPAQYVEFFQEIRTQDCGRQVRQVFRRGA